MRTLESKCLVPMAILALILTGCGASLYKKQAESFGKATTQAATGYSALLDEFEAARLTAQARSIDGAWINTPERLLVAMEFEGSTGLVTRRALSKALGEYGRALVDLASVGTAKAAGDGLKNLGAQVESADAGDAKDAGALLGKLGQILIDHNLGRKISTSVAEADPVIQTIVGKLTSEIDQMESGLVAELATEWNRMRVELNRRSAEPGFQGTTGSAELLLGLRANLLRRRQVEELAEKTGKALRVLGESHASLQTRVRGEGGKDLLIQLQAFVAAANSVADSIDALN